jgi:hypothetical protein
MGKSTTPFGESVKQQSVTKKIFELAKASLTDFFINISPLFTLSKIKIIHWGSNNKKRLTKITKPELCNRSLTKSKNHSKIRGRKANRLGVR